MFIKTCKNIFNSFRSYSRVLKMTDKAPIELIKQNAEIAKQTIDELKNELKFINKEYNSMLSRQLMEENAKLVAAVEDAKKKLIGLELKNDIKQIPIPSVRNMSTVPVIDTIKTENASENQSEIVEEPSKKEKVKKEKKVKEVKADATTDLPIDIGRLDLRIGKIIDVQRHPDADALYVSKIDCGEDKPRTVCSGLVKHVPIEELKDRTVLVLCNLKPVKMRGVTSEAMVMCASSEAGVEVLMPPKNSQPGECVFCEGFQRQPDTVMNPKKKIFETVAPDLHTNENFEACYKNSQLFVEGKGFITSKSLKNVPVK